MESALPLVSLLSVSKFYSRAEERVSALREVSCDIKAGEFVGLAGPSGSGKSTLLNVLGLTDAPSSGSLSLQGEPVDFSKEAALRELRRTKIGYVFQYFNLVPSLTATENVAISLLLNGCSYRAAAAQARELLAKVGLEARALHLPQQLSGGEMQRVAFCRAIIHKPRLLLADEPTGNLDSHTGDAILDLIAEAALGGAGVIMASHNEQALKRCSRVMRMRDGALRA
ncbi:MAG: ABC transporter ATP-binding protein [Deltaproteobacteria bacterium]|nr:ABC transporter ATP-binding protein [Deltaproteobacteria bacterium]